MYKSKMAKFVVLIIVAVFFASWSVNTNFENIITNSDSLRNAYSKSINEWPKPFIDKGVNYKELAPLPEDSSWLLVEKDDKVKLGQILFFDPRLSSSNQISCSSCHDPELGWGDGRRVSLGNDHLLGTRNTPSLFNLAAAHQSFFWDGRSLTLESQAVNPIAAHHEMNMETALLSKKIDSIEGYKKMFAKVYGKQPITLENILDAIKAFELIIKTRQSDFDRFVRGKYDAFSDEEIRGLDLFRRKARCMNCHNGTYFTDDLFHNIGLTYYKRKYQDLGRYEITKKPEDVGKFRTPSLRDVMKTNPWMHNGLFDNMAGIINMYNSGMHQLDEKNTNPADSLYPKTDPLLLPLGLTTQEKQDLLAFLNTITATQYKMRRPDLPK